MGLIVRGFFFLIGVVALIQSAAKFFGGVAQGSVPGMILALFGLDDGPVFLSVRVGVTQALLAVEKRCRRQPWKQLTFPRNSAVDSPELFKSLIMSLQIPARVAAALWVAACLASVSNIARAADVARGVGVGPQYDSSHVYVAPEDADRFVASFIATFGGRSGKQVVATVTPTPSRTTSQIIQTPVGIVSLFGYETPIPFPFGAERTGFLVTDMDEAIRAARAAGADVLVAPFDDPIGRDAIIEWPGGVDTQLYWHTIPPAYPPLQTVPENRVYVSPVAAESFVQSFLRFSLGRVVSDDPGAPGVEIGRPGETYRRIRIESTFGKMTAFVTDGHIPYPYGRETTGYEVTNFADTMAKAKAAGVVLIVAPYTSDGRDAAMVQFPGGYIAEIHAAAR